MPTDDERREVARRLRECRDIRKFTEAMGFPWDVESDWTWSDVTARLADLIEPSDYECVPGECPLNVRHDSDFIDRDALLALADEMSMDGIDGFLIPMPEYARRIREACGEVVA